MLSRGKHREAEPLVHAAIVDRQGIANHWTLVRSWEQAGALCFKEALAASKLGVLVDELAAIDTQLHDDLPSI
jgi:hypothetical protein